MRRRWSWTRCLPPSCGGGWETAIKGLIDFEIWNRQVAVQEVEFDCIADFAARIKGLPQLQGRP
ncbi:MAG: hypothetical protein ABSH49_26965 [Bryobacteraceae bacterium]|jgi:hypothetical protein